MSVAKFTYFFYSGAGGLTNHYDNYSHWDCISPQISNKTCFFAKILFTQNENVFGSVFSEVYWSENLV